MLVYSASTEPPPAFVEAVEVAIARIDGSGRSIEQRTAAVEALLAEHGLREIVERQLATLLRARARRAAESPRRGAARGTTS
jgi:ABC-type sugar transport system substrate-binding protein